MIKRGMILGGGLGTRLAPLTHTRNKHTLLVAGRPMISYPIQALVREGVTEIAIGLNGPFGHQVEELVGDGAKYGCRISYFYTEVFGTVYTLLGAKEWLTASDDDFVVLFGDGIFFEPLRLATVQGPHLFLMHLPLGSTFDDPMKYAQAVIRHNRIVELVEKPEQFMSPFVQAGAFVYPPDALEICRALTAASTGGEIGLTDLNEQLVNEGRMRYSVLAEGAYVDCGTHAALAAAEERLRQA